MGITMVAGRDSREVGRDGREKWSKGKRALNCYLTSFGGEQE